jgi:pimeloyl-ACP methyl ester carboxylesterase
MIGDRLEFFDNRVPSDVLLGFVPACGLSGDQYASILRSTRYRAMALTPFGFEADRKRRAPLSLEDHLVFAREWLRAMRAVVKPRLVVVVGFSSGADVALRLAGAEDVEINGCLSLGCNLSLETCFLTQVLGRVESGKDEATLAALRAVGASASSLDDWINVHEYLVAIARKYRNGLEPLRRFATGITEPFESGAALAPFVQWYVEATGKGRSLRAVFEDRGVYPELLKELHLRNIDEKILGDRYEEDSIVIEPDAGHFDLLDPARVERNLDALVGRIRARKSGSK